MSPLHHDRLLAEGAAPADQAAPTPAPRRSTSTSSSGNRKAKAESPVPSQRQGKTQPTRSRTTAVPTTPGGSRPAAGASRGAAGTIAATAKAARTATAKVANSRAVAAGAETARSVSTKAATATVTVTRRATTAARAAAAAKRVAVIGERVAAQPAAAGRATAAPEPARATQPVGAAPRDRDRSGGRHRAEARASARITAARAVVARVIATKVAASVPAPTVATRPTPYRRTASAVPQARVAPELSSPAPDRGETALVVVTAPAMDPAAAVPVPTRDGGPRRGQWSSRRRSLHLAAALVGALSISGASAGQPTEVRTTTVSASVSVAEELGLEGPTLARGIADAEVSSRLGELVVSRNARDAERTAAANAQAEADRLAVVAAEEAARPDAVPPVQGARLTSGFGARWGTLHGGIDLAAPMRTPEYAVMDGVVLEAGPASGFGLVVYIQHENGDVTVYGHMDEILVGAGQVVRAGDTIALLGNRGQSTGPHLHFEVHVGGLNGQKIDPVAWLRERGVHL